MIKKFFIIIAALIFVALPLSRTVLAGTGGTEGGSPPPAGGGGGGSGVTDPISTYKPDDITLFFKDDSNRSFYLGLDRPNKKATIFVKNPNMETAIVTSEITIYYKSNEVFYKLNEANSKGPALTKADNSFADLYVDVGGEFWMVTVNVFNSATGKYEPNNSIDGFSYNARLDSFFPNFSKSLATDTSPFSGLTGNELLNSRSSWQRSCINGIATSYFKENRLSLNIDPDKPDLDIGGRTRRADFQEKKPADYARCERERIAQLTPPPAAVVAPEPAVATPLSKKISEQFAKMSVVTESINAISRNIFHVLDRVAGRSATRFGSNPLGSFTINTIEGVMVGNIYTKTLEARLDNIPKFTNVHAASSFDEPETTTIWAQQGRRSLVVVVANADQITANSSEAKLAKAVVSKINSHDLGLSGNEVKDRAQMQYTKKRGGTFNTALLGSRLKRLTGTGTATIVPTKFIVRFDGNQETIDTCLRPSVTIVDASASC